MVGAYINVFTGRCSCLCLDILILPVLCLCLCPAADGTCDSSSRSADSGNGSGDTEMSESVRSLVQDLNTGVSRDANDFLSRNHHASQTMDGKIFSTMVAAMADNMPYRSGADGSDADLKRSEDCESAQ